MDPSRRRWAPAGAQNAPALPLSGKSRGYGAPSPAPAPSCCTCCGDWLHKRCCEAITPEDVGREAEAKGFCRGAPAGSVAHALGMALEKAASIYHRLDFRIVMVISLIRFIFTIVIVSRGALQNGGKGPTPNGPRVARLWEMRATGEVVGTYSIDELGMFKSQPDEDEGEVELRRYDLTGFSKPVEASCTDEVFTWPRIHYPYITSGCTVDLDNAVVPVYKNTRRRRRRRLVDSEKNTTQLLAPSSSNMSWAVHAAGALDWMRSGMGLPRKLASSNESATGNKYTAGFALQRFDPSENDPDDDTYGKRDPVCFDTIYYPMPFKHFGDAEVGRAIANRTALSGSVRACTKGPNPLTFEPPNSMYVLAALPMAGSPSESAGIATAGFVLFITGLVPTLFLAAHAIFMPLPLCTYFCCKTCKWHNDCGIECESELECCRNGRCCGCQCCFCKCCMECADCGCCQTCRCCGCCDDPPPSQATNSPPADTKPDHDGSGGGGGDVTTAPSPLTPLSPTPLLPVSDEPTKRKEGDRDADVRDGGDDGGSGGDGVDEEKKSAIIAWAEGLVGTKETAIARLDDLYNRPWQRLNIAVLSYAVALIAAIPVRASCSGDPVIDEYTTLCPKDPLLCLASCSATYASSSCVNAGKIEGPVCEEITIISSARLNLNLILTGYLLYHFVSAHIAPARVNPRRVPQCCVCCTRPDAMYEMQLIEPVPSEAGESNEGYPGDADDHLKVEVEGEGEALLMVGSLPPSRHQDCCECCHQRGPRLVTEPKVWAASMSQFSAQLGLVLITDLIIFASSERDQLLHIFGSVTFQEAWGLLLALFAQIPAAVFAGVITPREY